MVCNMRIRNSISLYFFGLVVAVLWAVLQPAHTDTGFRAWIQNFRGEAISQGVTGSVYDDAFRGVTEPDLLVLEKANYQPEFKAEVWEYLDSRVQERAITNGQVMLQQYAKELASIEKSSGVDRHVLLAIW